MYVTLARVATEFLDRPQLAQSTIRSYETALLPILQQHGYTPIDRLTRSSLEQYLNTLTHLSYTTHNRHQATLVALLNFAVEQGYLPTNPLAHLKRRKPAPLRGSLRDRAKGEHHSDETIRYLTPEQLATLYSLIEPNSRLHALILLLHRTGARIAEALALDLSHIDLERRKFPVIGKGNKKRWCYYGDDLALVLKTYLRLYRHPHPHALFTAQQPTHRQNYAPLVTHRLPRLARTHPTERNPS